MKEKETKSPKPPPKLTLSKQTIGVLRVRTSVKAGGGSLGCPPPLTSYDYTCRRV
jgi:hypothetical protein